MFNNKFIFSKVKFLLFLKFFLIGIGYGSGSGIPDTRQVRGWDKTFKPVKYRVRVWGHVGESESGIGETILFPAPPHCHV